MVSVSPPGGVVDFAKRAERVDMLDDGLAIGAGHDREALDDLAKAAGANAIYFVICTESAAGSPVLIVRPHDKLCGLWAPGRTILLVCAASTAWITVNQGDNQDRGCEVETAGAFHLGADVARLVAAIVDPTLHGRMAEIYRATKCREIFCAVLPQYFTGALIPAVSDRLTARDAQRLVEAHRIIATRFGEKLTLATISRACGLNRTKLAMGFRELFDRTIAEAISEERLKWAAHELKVGDMPISQIAHECSYLSHASFTRAFTKHYGVSPKHWRHTHREQTCALGAVSL